MTLDGSYTIGNIVFGDQGNAHNWTLSPGSGGTLTCMVSNGMPTITVINQTATIAAVLGGSLGLAKAGSGTLVLTAANSYTGPTLVSGGTLLVNGSLAAGGTLTVDSGGAMSLGSYGNISPQDQYVGIAGNGTVTQLGGTNSISGNLSFAYNAGSSGAYGLNTSGQLSACGEYIDFAAGATAAFQQTGGTNSTSLFVDRQLRQLPPRRWPLAGQRQPA